MAARAAFGIISIKETPRKTASNKKIPWKKFAQSVTAPLLIFAELLAISLIIRKPPNKPANVFPMPTAIISLLKFDLRR